MLLSRESPPPPEARRPRRQPLVWVVVALSGLLAGAVAAIIAITDGHSSSTGATSSASLAGANHLDVLPFPGTPDASPSTQITFPALIRSELKSVIAMGSRSGRHRGRLVALPGGHGTAFVADRRFEDGERVSVTARLNSRAAGSALGAPNATRVRFSFTVGTQTGLSPGGTAAGPANPAKPPPPQSFRSAPNLHPPPVKVTADPDQSSGDVFLTMQDAPQSGPMILDSRGQVVWFHPLNNSHHSATDLSVQRYHGRPVLTWWQGRIVKPGFGTEGQDVILNNAYQRVATLHGAEGYSSDVHEFRLTPQGTALVTAYTTVKADLSSVGGHRNGTVLDSIVQELDVRTGRLLWEWHALGHVPMTASELGKPKTGTPYDFFHINSIQELPDGNLLISARNTWSVYEISRITGRVVWTLGGKDSDFKMGEGTNFEWQHDARLHPGGMLSLFDDGAGPKEESQSRGLELNLDLHSMQASLKHAYTHSPSVLASAEGGFQVLPNGSVLVGWGTEPHFSEYTVGGRQIWDGSFSNPVESYRAYRFPWSGRPADHPAISVSAASSAAVSVFASWNGATDVARWQLLAGSSTDNLTPVATVDKSGFETTIRAKTSGRYLAVRALAASGRALGMSKVVRR